MILRDLGQGRFTSLLTVQCSATEEDRPLLFQTTLTPHHSAARHTLHYAMPPVYRSFLQRRLVRAIVDLGPGAVGIRIYRR